MIRLMPLAVRMNNCLFFVVFAMKSAGCSRRMQRDGWIKARPEEGVRMKPLHSGGGVAAWFGGEGVGG